MERFGFIECLAPSLPMENVKEKKAREKTHETEVQQKKAEDYYQLIVDCPLCALSLLKIEKVKREQEFQRMQGRAIEGIFLSHSSQHLRF